MVEVTSPRLKPRLPGLLLTPLKVESVNMRLSAETNSCRREPLPTACCILTVPSGILPCGLSLTGTLRGVVFCSAVIRIHLPASLCSTGVAPLHGYYGRSDSWAALDRRPGLPDSRGTDVFHPPYPSTHSAANHPLPSSSGFNT